MRTFQIQNKGVLTLMSIVNADTSTQKQLDKGYKNSNLNAALEGSEELKSKKAALNNLIEKTPDIESVSNPDVGNNLSKGSDNSRWAKIFSKWNRSKIVSRGKDLLRNITPKNQIPKEVLTGMIGPGSERVRTEYQKFEKFLFKTAALGRFIDWVTDVDGTCTSKLAERVENTAGTGGTDDKKSLRTINKGVTVFNNDKESFNSIVPFAGTYNPGYKILTARTGTHPAQSRTGAEGWKLKEGKGIFVNFANGKAAKNQNLNPDAINAPVSSNRLSSIYQEFGIENLVDPENLELFKNMTVNGISGAIQFDANTGSIGVRESTTKFSEIVNFLENITDLKGYQGAGLVSQLEKSIYNKAEENPMRGCEYKGLPKIFLDTLESKTEEETGNPMLWSKFPLESYWKYMDLVQESREKNFSSEKFVNEVEKMDLPFPEKYKSLIQRIKDPSQAEVEQDLTDAMRQAEIACITPHMFDSRKVIRSEKYYEGMKLWADFLRSDQAQNYAHDNFGIPHEGQGRIGELISFNGRDVSSIKFEADGIVTKEGKKIKNTEELVKYINKLPRVSPDQKNFILVDFKSNFPQPYAEMGAPGQKSEALPSQQTMIDNNLSVVMCEDSSSNVTALSGALARGTIRLNPQQREYYAAEGLLTESEKEKGILKVGGAYLVRGLITPTQVVESLIEDLCEEQYSNHIFALEKLDENTFKLKETGETKSKEDLTKYLLEEYKDNIFLSYNISESNFKISKVFERFFGDDLKLDSTWEKSLNARKQTLMTPLYIKKDKDGKHLSLFEDLQKKFKFERPLSMNPKWGWMAKVPILKETFAKDPNSAPFFGKFIVGIGQLVRGLAGASLAAKAAGAKPLAAVLEKVQLVPTMFSAMGVAITKGLQSSLYSPWQFLGELANTAAALPFVSGIAESTGLAFGNMIQIGRAMEIFLGENLNFDSFDMTDNGTKAIVDEHFTGAGAKFKTQRNTSREYSERREEIMVHLTEKFMGGALGKLPGSQFLALGVADFMLALRATKELFSKEGSGLRVGIMDSLLHPFNGGKLKYNRKQSGANNFGLHSPQHIYAALGIGSVASGALGVLSSFKSKFLQQKFASIGKALGGLGVMVGATHEMKDPAGTQRISTNVNGDQIHYSPEKSGFDKYKAGLIQMVGSLVEFAGFEDLGSSIYNFGTGQFFVGMGDEIRALGDAPNVNDRMREGDYVMEMDKDVNPPDGLRERVATFHAGKNNIVNSVLSAIQGEKKQVPQMA